MQGRRLILYRHGHMSIQGQRKAGLPVIIHLTRRVQADQLRVLADQSLAIPDQSPVQADQSRVLANQSRVQPE